MPANASFCYRPANPILPIGLLHSSCSFLSLQKIQENSEKARHLIWAIGLVFETNLLT